MAFAASLLQQFYLRFWDLPQQQIHAVNLVTLYQQVFGGKNANAVMGVW